MERSRTTLTDPAFDPQSAEATHSPDGVDLTLIRWMLSLTYAERLEVLQANVRSILILRDAIPRP